MAEKLEGSPHCSNEEIEELTRKFDETTKLNIHSSDEAAYLTIGGLRYNNPQFNIKRGALRLSGEEATSLFDESIKAIIDAFGQQRKTFNTRFTVSSREEATSLFDESIKAIIDAFGQQRKTFNTRFTVSSREEATSLFDESIKAIIDAFGQQRKTFNTRFTMAFLVGGLGANNFVWSRLQSHFRELGIDGSLTRSRNKAVANGAVIFHIDRAVKSRVARATYGVPYSPWVDESDPEHRRRRHQWYKSPSGRYQVNGGFCPILLKGDQVDEQKEIRYSFCFMNRYQAEFGGEQMNIMCYRGKLPHPRWLDEDSSSFAGLGTIQANLSKVANNQVVQRGISGETYYQVDFDVVAFFGSTELTAQMAWKHNGIEERTPVTIAYYDD
ncbi:hypothetical protein L210DRAFT_3650122 [Boletus edulis BED1]|uniref:Uncharacterized protein n=1 Tax=Boletus edulis BED1 TaxID=1328754 RepID=A0AAD4BK46_BOLED|nr:hypothetical protein L210DRAFT_3650122 [Boletus edulis BED1]